MSTNDKSRFTMTPSANKNEKSTTVTLEGDLSLKNMNELKKLLSQNLEKYNLFKVIVENVNTIDLGAIQLLQSFSWSASQKGKKVHFDFNLPEDHRILLERAGFEELIREKTK